MISALAIASAAIALLAGVWYNRDIFRGDIRPNLSSWAVWTGITILSSTSYFLASSDVLKSLLAFANSTVTIITFGLIVFRGRFTKVGRFDVIAGILGGTAVLVWFLGQSAAWGNLVLQAAILIGCVPTIRSVYHNPATERPGPWLFWAFSFVLGGAVVILRWTGHPLELAYSIVGVLGYGSIGVLALRRAV